MTDPYNSIGRQYDIEVFCKAIRPAMDAMSAALFKAIRRWETQHLEAGYDPYNNQRSRVTLSSSTPRNEEVMTERLAKARADVLATVQMYAPVHAQFAPEATLHINQALDEFEAATVEAVQTPGVSNYGEAPTHVVELKQPDAVGALEPPAPAALPNVVEGKPVAKDKSKSKS